MASKVEALKKTKLFAPAADEALEALAGRSRLLKVVAGTVLFSAGDPCSDLYVVASGRTRALRHGSDGREQIIHEDTAGAAFPAVSVFDGGPCPSSVVALEDSVLLAIPSHVILDFCLKHPRVALAGLKILSRRLRKTTGLIEGLALREVGQRVAEYLIDCAAAAGTDSFRLRHTNQDIADLIGTVREVVSRSFARLQKEGLISKKGREVRILDRQRLKDYTARAG